MGAADFIAAAKDPSLIRDLDPQAPTLEGYLFPSTYRLPYKITSQGLCLRLTRQFREVWHALHTTVPPHDIVTLAQRGALGLAAFYIVLSLAGGIAGLVAGLALMRAGA